MTTGQKWAAKSPPERVKLLRKICSELRDMADALEGAERQAIHTAARTVAGAAARTQAGIDLRARPQCCPEARMFGSCGCAA